MFLYDVDSIASEKKILITIYLIKKKKKKTLLKLFNCAVYIYSKYILYIIYHNRRSKQGDHKSRTTETYWTLVLSLSEKEDEKL